MTNGNLKGKQFERKVARMIASTMPGCDVRRGLQDRDGKEFADVNMPAFWPELKCRKAVSVRGALEQAESTNPGGRWSVAITKVDRKRPIATMYLDDWLELVGQWWEQRR